MAPSWRHRGLGSALITTLEHRLFAGGVRTVHAVLPEGETGAAALHNCGFDTRSGLVFFEKRGPVTPQAIGMLAALGAELPPGGLWQKVAGMEREKQLIERRLGPAAGPSGTGRPARGGAAARGHAVRSARDGQEHLRARDRQPPGMALRRTFPARLAAEYGLAAGLNRRFDEIARLDHALVFIDEVEEIAVERTGADRPRSASSTSCSRRSSGSAARTADCSSAPPTT